MRPRLVCDASAVVSLLLDSGDTGTWLAGRCAGADLYAPALVGFECANIIRRHESRTLISPDQAAQAHADLLDLPVELWPWDVLAERAWALRHNLTSYDAAYVALAEILEAPLVTLDRRLERAPATHCVVIVPPSM